MGKDGRPDAEGIEEPLRPPRDGGGPPVVGSGEHPWVAVAFHHQHLVARAAHRRGQGEPGEPPAQDQQIARQTPGFRPAHAHFMCS